VEGKGEDKREGRGGERIIATAGCFTALENRNKYYLMTEIKVKRMARREGIIGL